jgi:hypothetical protein
VSGLSSKVAAAVLVYCAALVTGREVTQREVAKFYGLSETGLRQALSRFRSVLPLKIVKSRVGVPLQVDVPKELCKELEKFAELSPKVVCT